MVVLLIPPHFGIHALPIVAYCDIWKRMGIIWVEDLHEGSVGTTKGRLTEIVETVATNLGGGKGGAQAASA